LILARHEGRFIKKCPGDRGYRCCDLNIIHLGLGCHLNCSYCILDAYLATDALVVFGNLDDAFAEIDAALSAPPPRPRRFCTGEFTDSLLLEKETGFGAALVQRFADQSDAVLELKTKTDHIDGLLGLRRNHRTVISFSVNAPAISRSEEPLAASLEKRLAAAARAVAAGYRVAFHFDPIIRHEGWRAGYQWTVEAIFRAAPKEKIAWISLGCFRYLPALKPPARSRGPGRIFLDEFQLAPDGKMRLPRPARVEMYRHLLAAVRDRDPEACVYMCMESPRVWEEVFGFDPGPSGLSRMLDARV
jgi:spore photoproduct lyase